MQVLSTCHAANAVSSNQTGGARSVTADTFAADKFLLCYHSLIVIANRL